MNTKTISAVATVLALGCSGTAAFARNWLTNEPEATFVPAPDASTPRDASINYGPRARMRIYRPDGEFEIRNGNYERSPQGQGDLDTETKHN